MASENYIEYLKFNIPLKSSFITALRSINSFEVHRLKIVTRNGTHGVAEVVATPAITGITTAQLEFDVNKSLIPFLKHHHPVSTEESYSILLNMLPNNPTARALGDLVIHSLLNASNHVAIFTDVTIPISTISEIPELVQSRITSQFSVFKIKLGADSALKNLQRIQTIKNLLPELSILRIDCNQAWSTEYTLEFLKLIERNDIQIEYLEQPTECNDFEALSIIRRQSNVPIMADESCFDLSDLKKLNDLNAVDSINIKILKAGGLTPARQIALMARELGIGVSIGCMIESPIGVKAAMQLAEEFGLNSTHDLDAAWWYEQNQLVYSNGMVQ